MVAEEMRVSREMARLRAEQEAQRQQLEQKMKTELEAFERQQQADVQRQLQESDDRMRQQLDMKMRHEAELRQRELDALHDVSEDTKFQLMQEHRRAMEELEESMMAEQYRQKQRLRVRLERRAELNRTQERMQKQAQVQQEMMQREREASLRELERIRKERFELEQQRKDKGVVAAGGSDSTGAASVAAAAAAVNDGSGADPTVLGKVTELEALMKQLDAKYNEYQTKRGLFVDAREADLAPLNTVGEPVVTLPDSLRPHDFVLYRYGVALVQQLLQSGPVAACDDEKQSPEVRLFSGKVGGVSAIAAQFACSDSRMHA
jgi:hypothetical protein